MKISVIILSLITFWHHGLPQEQQYFCPPCGSQCDKTVNRKPGECKHCGMTLVARSQKKQTELLMNLEKNNPNVAIYLHNGVEILDFAGPVEVFAYAGFNVYTVGFTKEPIISQGIVKIIPEYSIEDAPKPNIVAFFGGNGWNASSEEKVIDWLKEVSKDSELVFSVCTGAFFLSRAGLLEGKKATTFHDAIKSLRKVSPNTEVLDNVRYVDNGDVITTAGISAGIDGALHVVSRYYGEKKAKEVAFYMEYDRWEPNQGLIVKE